MIAALYLRISSDPNELRAGVERQLPACQRVVQSRWPDMETRIYEDNDTSAYRGKVRPAFARMCDDIRAGIVTAAVGYNFDRMFRLPRELEPFIDLCETVNLSRVATAQGDIDLTTHDGQLQARILCAVAKKSSDDTSRRVRDAATDRALKGRWHGGPVPYGYAPARDASGGLAVVEADAAALRWAVALVLDGASIKAVMRRWPDEHPRARRHSSHAGLRGALLNPIASGVTRAGVKALWPAIIDATTHERVVRLLTDDARDASVVKARTSWLTGTLSCGRCGTRMHTGSSQRVRRYECRGCWNGINARHTEIEVEAWMFEATRVVQVMTSVDLDAVAAEVLSVECRLEDATRMWMEGSLPREAFDVARKAALHRLSSLRGSLLSATVPESPSQLESRWDSMDATQRARAAREAFVEIVVAGATKGQGRFDPSRLKPRWRR